MYYSYILTYKVYQVIKLVVCFGFSPRFSISDVGVDAGATSHTYDPNCLKGYKLLGFSGLISLKEIKPLYCY